MQNAQNNLTVENLVAKYRNYVMEHCPHTIESDGYEEFTVPYDNNAYEQLLITLYTKIAAKEADMQIVNALSDYAKQYSARYSDALSPEEFSFLAENFKEVCSVCFSELEKQDHFPLRTSSTKEDLNFIKEHLTPSSGSTIFIANSAYCEIATLYPDCIIKGFTSNRDNFINKEWWALGQIRLYSLGITSKILPNADGCAEDEYLCDVDYFVWGATDTPIASFENANKIYKKLKPGSKILLFMYDFVSASDYNSMTHGLLTSLVKDKAIDTIISYESRSQFGNTLDKNLFVLASKSVHDIVHLVNLATDSTTDITAETLDKDILRPSYYMAARPKDGIPLSKLATLNDYLLDDLLVEHKDNEYVLLEEVKSMPVAIPSDMAIEYKDANLCQKELKLASNPIFDEWKGWIRVLKTPCVLLYGRGQNLLSGYIHEIPSSGMCTLYPIACLLPKEGIDVRYIAALLLSPEIRNQILTICEGKMDARNMSLLIDKIIVPNHTEKERLSFLVETSNRAIFDLYTEKEIEKEKKLSAMKADYINDVRMRKHDIRPHLRQLASTERLIQYYIDSSSNLQDLVNKIKEQLEYIHVAISSISAIVAHLSDEENFGEPEVINIDKYLTEFEINHNKDIENFDLTYDCDDSSFRNAGFAIPDFMEQFEARNKQGVSFTEFLMSKLKENEELPLFLTIAPVDFQRLVTNIIENARDHGFTDNTRTDYYLNINLSLNSEKNMYQIDFCNNGDPLPEGMNKERFGIRGLKVGKTGKGGNGGYIIKNIVTHYGGDYELFSDKDITTIRIFLPITRI